MRSRRSERSWQQGRGRSLLSAAERQSGRSRQREHHGCGCLRSHGAQRVGAMALRAAGRAVVARSVRRTLLVVLGLAGDSEIYRVFHGMGHARQLQPQHQTQHAHYQQHSRPGMAEWEVLRQTEHAPTLDGVTASRKARAATSRSDR